MKKQLLLLIMVGMLIGAGGCKRKSYTEVDATSYRASCVQTFFTLHPEFGSPSRVLTVPVHCYQNYQFRILTDTGRHFSINLKRDGRIVSVDEITKTGRKNWR